MNRRQLIKTTGLVALIPVITLVPDIAFGKLDVKTILPHSLCETALKDLLGNRLIWAEESDKYTNWKSIDESGNWKVSGIDRTKYLYGKEFYSYEDILDILHKEICISDALWFFVAHNMCYPKNHFSTMEVKTFKGDHNLYQINIRIRKNKNDFNYFWWSRSLSPYSYNNKYEIQDDIIRILRGFE